MPASAEQVHAGQAVYTPGALRIYDFLVLGLSNRWIWKCPTRELLRLFDEHVTQRHLDVGVGTGYFLDHCRFPGPRPRVALLDLNENCLRAAAARIARLEPTIHRANVLEPLPVEVLPCDSISLNYVLHCLPGCMAEKSLALAGLREKLCPGGVLFGATLLSSGVPRGWMARRLMAEYNRRGVFSNEGDDLESLRGVLEKHFDATKIRVVGCAPLFVSRVG